MPIKNVRGPGLWLGNGTPTEKDLMYSWEPKTIMTFYDYLGGNNVAKYKNAHPEVDVIVRFEHPKDWHKDVVASAKKYAAFIIGKWENDPVFRAIASYIDIANELDVHYENGDQNGKNQWMYQTEEWYKKIALWFGMVVQAIKEAHPEINVLSPAMAYGHDEDGAPDMNGVPSIGWAGYDKLAPIIKEYCDGILNAHYYWGNERGSNHDWLYDEEESSWHAFRWKRVVKLFENRYGFTPKIMITEAGNFAPQDPDFTDQIVYYSQECLKNPVVLGVVFFLWDDPTKSPGNLINSWVAKCRDLNEHVRRLKELKIETEPEDGKKMTTWHEDFRNKAMAYFKENGKPLSDIEDKFNISFKITPDATGKKMQLIGMHRLNGIENHGDHNIYFDVLDENGERMYDYYVKFVDNTAKELYPKVEKPANEPGGNTAIFVNQTIVSGKVLSQGDEYPSDFVRNISTNFEDEEEGATRGHFSFYFVWQLMAPPEIINPPEVTTPRCGFWCSLFKFLYEYLLGKNQK